MLRSLALLTFFLAILGASAVPSIERRQRAQVITSCTVPNTAALTFDDGPYVYLYDIVNALNAAGARGTFFFNGCIYDQANSDRVKYAYNQGHQVASHTWAHKDLTTLTWDQIHDEMWRVEQALVKITGAYPAHMRPPYGNYNNLVLDASGNRGQKVIIWDFDSQDSLGASAQTSKNLYNSIANQRPSTLLALNHETIVVQYAITRLQSAGYSLVTLAECIGAPAYQSVVAAGTRDSTWHC
ncbi:carbohydrate esterase family 4 protein [Crassisporium funariophilum]|nr:carbohydrate esterase family 4 protein [Crassisporium funariophilum]